MGAQQHTPEEQQQLKGLRLQLEETNSEIARLNADFLKICAKLDRMRSRARRIAFQIRTVERKAQDRRIGNLWSTPK